MSIIEIRKWPFERASLCRLKKAEGALYVEMAFSVIIFLVLLLFLIDAARYFYVKSVLNYAAHNAVDYASKIEVEIDTTNSHCNEVDKDSKLINLAGCLSYSKRVKGIVERGFKIASLVAFTQPYSRIRLKKFTHYDPTIYNPSEEPGYDSFLPKQEFWGAFLRPGEMVVREDGYKIIHPTRPFGLTKDSGWPNKALGENWGMILNQEPIIVIYEAVFQPYTPGIPPLILFSKAFGFRRSRFFSAGKPPVTSVVTTSIATTSSISETPVDCELCSFGQCNSEEWCATCPDCMYAQ